MDENILQESFYMGSDTALDAAIAEALRTAPLEPAPNELFMNVMRKVEVAPTRDQGVQSIAMPVNMGGAVALPRRQAGAREKNRATSYSPQPRFRASWIDLALSLFGAGMLAMALMFLGRLPQPWGDYMRLQALWYFQRLWYMNGDLLLWCGLALVVLLGGVIAGILSCARLGICSRGTS